MEEETTMEVNCNGHPSTPGGQASPESQVHGAKQSADEQEDEQNANQPENNTEDQDTLGNKHDHQTSSSLPRDPQLDEQQLPDSLNPNSVTLELRDGEKKEEDMETHRETKGQDEDKSQNG